MKSTCLDRRSVWYGQIGLSDRFQILQPPVAKSGAPGPPERSQSWSWTAPSPIGTTSGASSSPATPTETPSGSSTWHVSLPEVTARSSSRSAEREPPTLGLLGRRQLVQMAMPSDCQAPLSMAARPCPKMSIKVRGHGGQDACCSGLYLVISSSLVPNVIMLPSGPGRPRSIGWRLS